MSETAIQLNAVSCAFDALEVIQNFDLEVMKGEFVALVGPSGCGKTTLLDIISGHRAPNAGAVTASGRVRAIYQKDGLFPWLTARQNILLGLRETAPKTERSRQLEELLALIKLEEFADYYPRQLSGGMKQRVELARALAGDSDILLMDEPFSALDYQTRLRMRHELIRLLAQRPRTVVLVTHDLEEAAQLADRIFVLTDRPARIRRELRVNLARPRDLTHPEVIETMRQMVETLGLGGASLADVLT